MKKLFRLILIPIMCSFILTGCWDQIIFEKVGLVLTAGIEQAPNGELTINYAYPVVDSSKKDAVGLEITEATLVRGAREKARLSSPKYMEGGKIQQVLLSDSLAKNGIHDILEIFQRDVSLPAIAYIVVVEGSPSELLKEASQFKNTPRVSFYLFQLVDNNVQISNIPNTKVFDFDINFFAPGLDPVAPMIKLKENSVEITGSALFSDDKMVGRLSQTHTLFLIGLMDQAKKTDLIIPAEEFPSKNKAKYGMALTLQKPKRGVHIDFDEEGFPIIRVTMKYKCVLDEYRWNETTDPKEQEKLEKFITGYLNKHLNETIQIMQKANSDPIGFGDMIRAKYYEYWKSIDWKEIYPEAQIHVSSDVEIIREGLIK